MSERRLRTAQLPVSQWLACQLRVTSDAKIVLLGVDGLAGLPRRPGGRTELETARTPNLDELVREGVCGRLVHILPGVTPGSGPGHLALFGYDPLTYRIGRGVPEGLGNGFQPEPDDVLVRGNVVALGEDGTVLDRKGRGIRTEETAELVQKLQQIRLSGPHVQVLLQPLKDHRFLLVLRGAGLGAGVTDTDPGRAGVKPDPAVALDSGDEPSRRTAALLGEFAARAREILADEPKANGVLLRGCSKPPRDWPTFEDLYGLHAAAIAAYPMYRGLALLLGMEVIGRPESWEEQIDLLEAHWERYDFFFVHFKRPDREGEFGRFRAKVKAIEQFDATLPRVTDLNPAVLIVTGDHATPAVLWSHSWHPVPVVLASETCCPDRCTAFGEREARDGGLGDLKAVELMLVALAHARRLRKWE